VGGGLRERSEAERTDKIKQAARGGCEGPKGRSPTRQTFHYLFSGIALIFLLTIFTSFRVATLKINPRQKNRREQMGQALFA